MDRTLHDEPVRFRAGLQEPAPGVLAWIQPNGGWGESNAGLVVGDGEALLVDTLWDPVLTRRMLDAMAQRAPVPIRTLVNTHSDGDHVWGNQELAGAEIVATRTAAPIIAHEDPAGLRRFQALAPRLRRFAPLPGPRRLGRYVEDMLGPFDFAGVQVTPPTRTFEGELELSAGGRAVRLIEVGPAHTPGDLMVHVPDARVLFAGDVVFVGVAPVMWAGPTSRWIDAIDRLLGLEPDVVVPGHGPVCGRDEVMVLRGYLEWVQAEGEPRLAAGRSVPEAARELLREMADFPWAGWDQHERIVVTLTTIDRQRRGVAGPVGPRERARIFAQVAGVAAELY